MDIHTQNVLTLRTARYFTLGEANAQTNELWIVLHGYGQLGNFFLRHFKPLAANGNRLIVAPEGLSRFYLGENKWDRVGASWMTKEDRQDEIRDQQQYLNTVYQQVSYGLKPDRMRLVVLGFSQGVATAWRWLQSPSAPKANSVVLWAGGIPQEEAFAQQQQPNKLWVVYGKQDPLIPQDKLLDTYNWLKLIGLQPEVLSFDGEHQLDGPTLQAVAQQIGEG